MNGCRPVLIAFVLLCLSAPSFAQSKAKAQNVPEIPYDSVANFFTVSYTHLTLPTTPYV